MHLCTYVSISVSVMEMFVPAHMVGDALAEFQAYMEKVKSQHKEEVCMTVSVCPCVFDRFSP